MLISWFVPLPSDVPLWGRERRLVPCLLVGTIHIQKSSALRKRRSDVILSTLFITATIRLCVPFFFCFQRAQVRHPRTVAEIAGSTPDEGEGEAAGTRTTHAR